MKFLTFSLFTVAIVSILGCSTENPICSTNFCAVGTVFPRSELHDEELFSEVDIDDSVIFDTLASTPRPSMPSVSFLSAIPPSGLIPENATITVAFDAAPSDVTVSAGIVTVVGKIATITGPFSPGALALTIIWADGTQTLNYTVLAPDTDPPTVTGGTVKDGDKDVDPKAINRDGEIEIEFSEDVSGHIALQTEGGADVGWIGEVEGNKATLYVVKGREIANEMTYVVKGKVSDAAGNSIDVSVTFVTKGEA